MKYLLYITILLLTCFNYSLKASPIQPIKTSKTSIADQSSAEIIRQLVADYEKFIVLIRKKSLKRSVSWWMKQNRKFDRLEERRENLKDALGDKHKEKLKKWAEEYRENKKHFV